MQNSAGFRKHMAKPKKGFVSYELVTIIKWSHFDVVIKKKYLLWESLVLFLLNCDYHLKREFQELFEFFPEHLTPTSSR